MEIRVPDDLGEEEQSLLVMLDFDGVEGPLTLERPFRRRCPRGDHELVVFGFLEKAGSRRYEASVCRFCGTERLLPAATAA